MEKGLRPVGSSLQRTGITADQLTLVGLGMAVATAVAIGAGELRLGLVFLALSSVPDMLDGAVAKASGTASPRGAFFDSVCDRASDALVLGGVAWHLASVEGPHTSMLAFAVLACSSLISYQRARAESLGYAARGGLMERAERIVMLGFGLAFPVILVPLLWAMLALTGFTVVQRFVKVWRQATPATESVPPRRTVEDRWRAWRESVPSWREAMPRDRRTDRGSRAHGARASRRWRVRTRP
jgi:CDP-diacylglycerol--glycerol-3-phosphate 3-phosphatidyltransferase